MALSKNLRPVFDTNVFQSYRARLTREDYRRMALSVVVLYELTARPINEESFKESILLRDKYRDNGKLIVPTMDDWWTCAEAVRKLRLEQQRQHKGATPRWITRRNFKTMR